MAAPSGPPQKAFVLARTCAALSVDDETSARSILAADYPLVATVKAPRRYSIQQMLRTFYRDGFIDRYSGERLVHPGALRTLSVVLPEEFLRTRSGR